MAQPTNASWRALAKKFDFGGLCVTWLIELTPTSHLICRILFMAGTSCIIVGFSFANEAGCKGPDLLCIDVDLI